MTNNYLKIIYIYILISTFIWCCDLNYVEINNECYYKKDLEFLEALIINSQTGSNPPPYDLDPLDLGWQYWSNGRLLEFCCSASTNTE